MKETDRNSSTVHPDSKESTRKHRPWLIYASLALVVVLVALYWLWPAYHDFLHEAWNVLTSEDTTRIKNWVNQFGIWGPFLIIIVMTLQMFLFVIPSWLLMVIAVLAYGPVLGTLLSIGAVAVASSVGYGLGRALGRTALHRLLGAKKEESIRRETERYGIWAIVIARINPLISNDAISLIGGMLRMGFWKFMGATLGGITPLAIAIAIFGRDWTRMKSGLLWLSIISVVGLGLKIWFDKRKEKNK